VQPSEERLELVKILESLQIGRLNRRLWFPPATRFAVSVASRRQASRRQPAQQLATLQRLLHHH